MLMKDADFIPPRDSLLSRLKNYDDQESWRKPAQTGTMEHFKLRHGFASQTAISRADAHS